MKDFLKKFDFRSDGRLLVGIERECFLAWCGGRIAPIAPEALGVLTDRRRFGYELSTCQLEDRAGPARIEDIRCELVKNEAEIQTAERKLGFSRIFLEVAPEDIPLDIYPDPSGRYQKITRGMPREILLAACRVAGTHIHIGMPNHEIALRVYNSVRKHFDMLCHRGNGSDGKRLEIYKIMAPDFFPPRYESWDDYYRAAVEKKFVSDPRKCWHLIRISVHGTIEFRMFGSTPNLDMIVNWARVCHSLCATAMDL